MPLPDGCPFQYIVHPSKVKLSIKTPATQQTFTQTPSPHSHYNGHKSNIRHIHRSIVSMHLATRGNNKILRTPPPHISGPERKLPLITRCTLAQLRTNKSYLHKVDANSHTSRLCSLYNTHPHNTHLPTVPTYAPGCHPWIYGRDPLE